MEQEQIKVINRSLWIHSQDNCANSGMCSFITHCSCNGIEFHVRENITGIDSFLISSGERLGDKAGRKPRAERQILELLAPKQHWQDIALLVTQADTMNRRVLKNNAFTQQWLKNNCINLH